MMCVIRIGKTQVREDNAECAIVSNTSYFECV